MSILNVLQSLERVHLLVHYVPDHGSCREISQRMQALCAITCHTEGYNEGTLLVATSLWTMSNSFPVPVVFPIYNNRHMPQMRFCPKWNRLLRSSYYRLIRLQWNILRFWRAVCGTLRILQPCDAVFKVKEGWNSKFLETSLSFCQTTRRHILEDCSWNYSCVFFFCISLFILCSRIAQ
jgi:hypothetical protein